MARGGLTNDEWALIEPHLPVGERGPIPDLRRQFNAVVWRFRTGSPWRDVPDEYGFVVHRLRSVPVVGDRGRLPEPDGRPRSPRPPPAGRQTRTWSAWTPPRPVPTTTPPGWRSIRSCWRRWKRLPTRKRGFAKGA